MESVKVTTDAPAKGQAAALYEQLSGDRLIFLTRAIECSRLTIPTLIPPVGHSRGTKYYTPYQSTGARGVNNLAAKLLISLFPVNMPFFKLSITDSVLQRLGASRSDVEAALSKIEQDAQREIEESGVRVIAFEGLKLLIVSGNALLYLPDDGGMRVFSMHNYVCQRDPFGNVMDVITKECVAPAALPEEVQAMLAGSKPESKETSEDDRGERTKTVDLYTHVYLDDGLWRVYQQVEGCVVPGSKGSYPKENCPFIPLRFNRIDGEDYGRGYVEEYLGDLKSLEGLSQSIVEGAAIASRMIFMVNPNGTTKKKALTEAPNGAVIEGNKDEVSVLQADKFNDFRVAKETIDDLKEQLAYAFLLNSAIQRNGERVTAEEIRYMSNELDAALGGVYSMMSLEMQKPIVGQLLFNMQRQKKIPAFPKGTVKPVIIAGMEAIGRGNDFDKLTQFLALATQVATLPPEVDRSDVLKRGAAAIGINTDTLIKSAEQLQQERQTAQQQALAQQAIGPGVTAAGSLLKQAMTPGSAPASPMG